MSYKIIFHTQVSQKTYKNKKEAEVIATSLKKVFGEDSVYVIAINELEGRKKWKWVNSKLEIKFTD